MSWDSDDPDGFTGTLMRPDEDALAWMGQQENAAGMADEGKITVKFTTDLPEEFRVIETPFEVPSEFARLGLSEVINHLLSLEEKVPFDFLIDGQFLRTSLKHWRKQQAQERSVVHIKYVKALVAPQEMHDSLHLDWVKCVSHRGRWCVTGSFDSSVRVFDATQQYRQVYTMENVLDGREVWDCQWIDDSLLICGGKNCTARLLAWDGARLEPRNSMVIPVSVTSVAAWPGAPAVKAAVGGHNGGVYFYEVDPAAAPGEEEGPAKRQRAQVQPDDPALSLAAHRGAITSMSWRESGRIVTSSMDKSAKCWDIDSAVPVSTFSCNKAVVSCDWSLEQHAVLTGYSDGAIGLWDTRTGSGQQRQFRSHAGWTSALRLRENSPIFLSGSYDNTVKVWDLRSNIPLYTLGNSADLSADKVFAVEWGGENRDEILSAGTEKKLKVYEANGMDR